jgi:hypothetical protein
MLKAFDRLTEPADEPKSAAGKKPLCSHTTHTNIFRAVCFVFAVGFLFVFLGYGDAYGTLSSRESAQVLLAVPCFSVVYFCSCSEHHLGHKRLITVPTYQRPTR